jgi:hypothetical protein
LISGSTLVLAGTLAATDDRAALAVLVAAVLLKRAITDLDPAGHRLLIGDCDTAFLAAPRAKRGSTPGATDSADTVPSPLVNFVTILRAVLGAVLGVVSGTILSALPGRDTGWQPCAVASHGQFRSALWLVCDLGPAGRSERKSFLVFPDAVGDADWRRLRRMLLQGG